jgi:HK97 family phage major capsid protein
MDEKEKENKTEDSPENKTVNTEEFKKVAKELLADFMKQYKATEIPDRSDLPDSKKGAVPIDTRMKQFDTELHEMHAGKRREVKVTKTMNLSMGAVGVMKAVTNAEGTDSAGGYLVPQEYGTFIPNVNDAGYVRANAFIVPMIRDKMNYPYVATDITAGAVNELQGGTSSNFIFGNVQLNTTKYMALVPMANELVNDTAYPMGNIIGQSFTKQFNIDEDTLFNTRINSVGNAYGLTGSASGTFTATVTSAEIFAQLISVLESVNTEYSNGAVFIVHPSIYWLAAQWKDSQGKPIFDISQPLPKLHGFPVFKSNRFTNATTSTAGKVIIAFGSMGDGCILGDRMQLDIYEAKEGTVNSISMLETDQTCFRGIERFDIQLVPDRFAVYRLSA